MGLASKILDGEKPEFRDYVLPAIVLSTLCIGGAILLVESNTPKEMYRSVKDITYALISDPLSR
ncbi:hypothetical protein HY500_00095 [Candidatus Woesearchaeota archaeon]|nr:hypothetical protein [Candidatus Woesearchaeota archaeon]